MNRIAAGGGARSDLSQRHPGAARRAGGDRRRRHRRRRAPDRRDARSLRHHLLDLFRLDRACASRANGRSRRSSRSRRISPPGRNCRWSGACIAWSPRMRTIRTTWWSAPAASPSRDGFAKAGRRVIIVAGVPLGTPGATNMLRIAFVRSRSGRRADLDRRAATRWRATMCTIFVDRRHHAIRPRVMRHVSDAFQQFQPRIRNRVRQRVRMHVVRYGPVAIADEDDRRRRGSRHRAAPAFRDWLSARSCRAHWPRRPSAAAPERSQSGAT